MTLTASCAPCQRLVNMLKTNRKLWLWAGLGIGVLLLGFLSVLLLLGNRTAAPEPPTETTQATLPAPEKSIFSPEEFAYEGDYLTCLSGESVLGIDVSSHQKQIDWAQVKAAGVEFVMIRAAYRGSIEGALSEDPYAQANYEGAKAAGLKVGAYIFTQGISVEEAREDARYILSITEGWELDLPLVYDWELIDERYRNSGVDARLLTDMALAFCRAVEDSGQEAMVYFNPEQSRTLLYLEELTDYGFWLAMYSDQMNYPYKVDMWQYSCTGTVAGIEGNVDINLLFQYDE